MYILPSPYLMDQSVYLWKLHESPIFNSSNPIVLKFFFLKFLKFTLARDKSLNTKCSNTYLTIYYRYFLRIKYTKSWRCRHTSARIMLNSAEVKVRCMASTVIFKAVNAKEVVLETARSLRKIIIRPRQLFRGLPSTSSFLVTQ